MQLRDVIELELKPYERRTQFDGIEVMLTAQEAQHLSLALHELATNAAKYGAFSNGIGTVRIAWSVRHRSEDQVLHFQWQECGGPVVVAPSRSGFGTSLLSATFPAISFDYAPDGLSCEFELMIHHSVDYRNARERARQAL